MFQFTTETIINTLDGHLTANDNFNVIEGSDGSKGRIGYDAKDLYIEKVGTFHWKDIASISATAGRKPVMDKVEMTVDIPSSYTFKGETVNLNEGDVIRLTLKATQEGRVISAFNNNYPIHINPYTWETTYEAGKVAEKLVKNFRDVQSMSNLKFFDITNDGNKLIVTATDEYTRIIEIEIVKVNYDDKSTGNSITGFGDYHVLYHWDSRKGGKANYTKGNVGTGTVSYILSKLRLPTYENFNPYAAFQDERPIPGTLYTQFLLEYVTPDIHGASYVAVGAQQMSKTSHVFFIPNELAKDVIAEMQGKAYTVNGGWDCFHYVKSDKMFSGDANYFNAEEKKEAAQDKTIFNPEEVPSKVTEDSEELA